MAMRSRPTSPTKGGNDRSRLVAIILDDKSLARTTPDIEHERKVAIFDLLEENRFDLVGASRGPYHLHLAVVENRLMFDVRDGEQNTCGMVHLSLSPFRRIVRDYFLVCESYFESIKSLPPSRIEAIDMGRRGLHDEGTELLRERLAGKIDLDFNTARRLFTLICVLHWRR